MGYYTDAIENQQLILNTYINDQEGRSLLVKMMREISWKDDEIKLYLKALNDTLEHCPSYFWSDKTLSIIGNVAGSIPDNWEFSQTRLPTPFGFFWFEKPLISPMGDIFHAFSWSPIITKNKKTQVERFGVVLTSFSTIPSRPYIPVPIPGSYIEIRYGDTPNDFKLNDKDDLWSYYEVQCFFSMLTFIEQKILTFRKESAPRFVRKRLSINTIDDSQIRIVYLRDKYKLEHDDSKPKQSKDWVCQWIVRGHWRQQWYPALCKHQPHWIAPYRKGPDDKPLKNAEKIFAVVR